MESIVYYVNEFDIVGGFLLTAAFLLLLLPFSLTPYGIAQYKSAIFISMIVIGFFLFIAFGLWERYGAHSHFIQWQVFKQPTVVGACGLSAFLFFSHYAWELYFYNFPMVVNGLSISMTGYGGQIYNVGSCFWSAVFGISVYVTKQFKYSCLGFGLPLILLGAGLMIHFRTPAGTSGISPCVKYLLPSGAGHW
ncbi:hypothetical protein BO70DRAFT_365897 [Aspergillus heteromorphus CBS 117.55]|uniref:MFS general substrate transporter n=1 Tax=Aspergillus heteromorphus CBS 117.55 TaxID=1448321 RepID=A0A317V8B8_9EURO|nr:uncharacterized protein BO70DRAFT_365897 [Aspergillus heteromorphus CBS 117.55]PWY69082.1 hypothetical protein BO70DRAFT_365897 [Aspergillus heteromorphus CBS 117.55]